jgi:hypothetical protein
VIKEIANPQNIFYTQPRWVEDDKNIITIAVTKNGNALMMVNTETGNSKTILDYTDVNISRPFPNGEYIFFSAGFENGIDNIYAVQLTTHQVFKITSVRFGAYEPCVSADGKKLLYSDYTADGYRLKEMPLDRNKFLLMNPAAPTDLNFHLPLLKSEGKDLSLMSFDSSFTSKKYHALTDGLFNIYGWFPIPNIPEYGVEFYTKNIMSTLQGTVGFLYNTNENNFHSYIKLNYAAFYPVFNLQYEYGKMRKGKNIDAATLQVNNLEWTENTVSAGLSLPFRLTQGTHYSNLNISALYEYYDVIQTDTVADVLTTDHFFFNGLKTTLNFSRLRQRAKRDVQPRWGETLNVSFQKAIDDNPLKFVAISQIFFPGFLKAQSFNIQLSYKQEEVINTYRYIDNFNYPRGYTPTPFETIYGFAANYEFPLWYPDLAAGPVAFFQRIRLNLFYDYSIGKVLNNNTTLSSTGAELFADFRMFRLFQVSAGMRYSYTFNNNFERKTPFQFLVTRFEFAN